MELIINSDKWSKVFLILKKIPKIHTKNEEKLRLFVSAVIWMTHAGCQWDRMPVIFGKPNSVRKRLSKWKKEGVLDEILGILAAQALNTPTVSIDSTYVKAHVLAAGQHKSTPEKECLGRSVGGIGTKIHVVVDNQGRPMHLLASPGNEHDIQKATELTKDVKATVIVIADRGYDSEAFVRELHRKNRSCVIPSRSTSKNPRAYDKEIYKERNLVERFFNKLKVFRRVFTRYDRSINAYMGFVTLASILIWLS